MDFTAATRAEGGLVVRNRAHFSICGSYMIRIVLVYQLHMYDLGTVLTRALLVTSGLILKNHSNQLKHLLVNSMILN